MKFKGYRPNLSQRPFIPSTPTSSINKRTAFTINNSSLMNASEQLEEKREFLLSPCHKENDDPVKKNIPNSFTLTPNFVPSRISDIKKRLEHQLSAACVTPSDSRQEVSPGLAKIQNTPGTLKKRRQELIVKHKSIQDHSDQLSVGGGVTLWPEMDVVRVTTKDMLRYVAAAVLMSLLIFIIFNKIHGNTFIQLHKFIQEVSAGCHRHKINVNNESFNSDVILWHKFLLHKTGTIQEYFTVSCASSHCVLYLSCYIVGMSVLVYFLVDNMKAKNRLTPLRIQTWICLLFVIGTWTVLIGCGLFLIIKLEQQAVHCVHQYASVLGYLVLTPLDLRTYQSVLLYWRTRLLDDSSDGMIHLLGIMTVKDLVFYLQYYSIPMATILLTPFIKLIINFKSVYSYGTHHIKGS